MPNHSNITITGHLGSDPQTNQAGNTTATSFSVAVNTGYGERKVATWYRVSIFGKRGETAAQHLTKGDAVTVSGELQNRPWTDKDGNERMSLEVNASQWSFAGGKQEGQPKSQKASTSDGDYFGDDPGF